MDSVCTTAPSTPRIFTWIASAIWRNSSTTPDERQTAHTETLRKQLLVFRERAWQTRRVLLGLFPELATAGGVQRAGRHVAAVMTEFAAGRGMECRLLSLNDTPELHRLAVGTREFVYTGSDRGKTRFSVT